MTHQDVIDGDIVDGYVARTLPAEDAAAFEAHYFECDECFDVVEATGSLRSGVREVSAAGELQPPVVSSGAFTRRARPVAWLPLAAAAALAGTAVWMQYSRAEGLERRLADAESRAVVLEGTLADARTARPPEPVAAASAESNVPLAILQTTRDSGSQVRLAIPEGATRFVLWLDDPPRVTAAPVDVVLVSSTGAELARAAGVRPNQEGALVVSFATAVTPPGVYTVQQTTAGRILGRYQLVIVRPLP